MAILKIRDENGVVQEVIAIRGEPGKNGEPGKDYVLTDADKKEIASLVDIPAEVIEHLTDKENPHVVTCEQIGAVAEEGFVDKVADTVIDDLNSGGRIYSEALGSSIAGEVDYALISYDLLKETEAGYISHAFDEENPHNVSCEQIGAITYEDAEMLVSTKPSYDDVANEVQSALSIAGLTNHAMDAGNPHKVTAE
jgi:hypothetical protein